MLAMSGQTTSAPENLDWSVPRAALLVACLSVAAWGSIVGALGWIMT
jgi:hypothetical protein